MRFEPFILAVLLALSAVAEVAAAEAADAEAADAEAAAAEAAKTAGGEDAPKTASSAPTAGDTASTDEASTATAAGTSSVEAAEPSTAPTPPAQTTAPTNDGIPTTDATPAPAVDAVDAAGTQPAVGETAALPFMVTASLQMESREFGAASKLLEEGIVQLEHETSRYDPALTPPLTLLGDAYFGQGELVRAQETYERAIHIQRVNYGLHSAEQVPLIYKEADTLAALGDFGRANERHEYAFQTLQRSYAPTSLELVPGMYRLAAWYKRIHNIFGARTLYDMAAANLARAYGPDSPELVLPLRGVAETYRQERFPPYDPPERRETISINPGGYAPSTTDTQVVVNRFGDGERALQEIVRILDADPETPRLDVALAILDLADWHLLFEKWDRAFTLYQHVRDRLRQEAGLGDAELSTYFSQPIPLYLPLPDNPPPPPADQRRNPTEGYVEIGYVVTDRGAVTALTTLGSEPEGMMDLRVRRAFRAARFRPRFEGDLPVATENLKFRHRFLYYPRVGAGEGVENTAESKEAQAAPAEEEAAPPANP